MNAMPAVQIGKHVEHIGLSAIGLIVFLCTWAAASFSGIVSQRVLPSPLNVALTMYELSSRPFAGYTLQQHVGSSLLRFCVGFLLAALVGIPTGLLMGWFRPFRYAFTPFFDAFRFVAPLAWVPFAALWFGTGFGGPILVIFSGAFSPCVINSFRGARLVEMRLVEAAQTLGASHTTIIREILLPGALPSIIAGLRISAGLGWQSLIGAELIVVSSGVGYLIVQGQGDFATPVVMAGMVAIGIVGILIDGVLLLAQKYISKGRSQ